jgi:hypothetical protein
MVVRACRLLVTGGRPALSQNIELLLCLTRTPVCVSVVSLNRTNPIREECSHYIVDKHGPENGRCSRKNIPHKTRTE